MNRYFTVRQSADAGETDILIYGDITSWPFEESDVSSYTLARAVREITTPRINVHINSYGGEVGEALAIVTNLRQSGREVVTYDDGFALSAAADIFMAGERRIMAPSSVLMIHNAMLGCCGNAAELRRQADNLELINDQTLKLFADKVQLSEAELRKLFDQETFLSPEQALALGFATGIAQAPRARLTQSARALVLQKLTGPAPEPSEPRGTVPTSQAARYAAFLQTIQQEV